MGEPVKTKAIEHNTRLKTGRLIWSELGQGVTRPDVLVKIKLGVAM